jgi:hypothetical protein
MPFLGTTPTQGFVGANPKQSFTANGSTTVFTLTHPVANANDLEVFVGNVRQEPTAAYSAAGTTLTMSEAPATGLNFYVINKSQAQVTTTLGANSVATSQIIDDAITGAKIENNPTIAGTLGVTGESTLTGGAKVNTIKHTGGTTAMTIDSAGRTFTPARPAFQAYGTGASWVIFSNGSWTKIVMNATPALNIGGHYDSTNSKFVAPVAGLYHFYYKLYGRVQSGGAASTYWQSRLQKNNSAITGHGAMIMAYYYNDGGKDETATDSLTISLAVGDEITLHAQSSGSHNGEYYGSNCNFGGHLLG